MITQAIKGNTPQQLRKIASLLTKPPFDWSHPHICLGPVVWKITPGHDQKHWYFITATSQSNGTAKISQIAGNENWLRQNRQTLPAALAQTRRASGILIHDFDDELIMAQWATAIWPRDPNIAQVYAAIARDRQPAP